jgi:hypothetical protein
MVAYEILFANHITYLPNWYEMKMAGVAWFLCFMARNSILNIRSTERHNLSDITLLTNQI